MKRQKTMVTQVKEYIAYKRKLGFQLRRQASQLLNFAKYADESGHISPVTYGIKSYFKGKPICGRCGKPDVNRLNKQEQRLFEETGFITIRAKKSLRGV